MKFSSGDILSGLASSLVALPSAIAFGLIIYAPLGGEFSGKAALAGIMGTISLGLIAPIFGGTNKLVSAPCAPAAAVLSVLVADIFKQNIIEKELIPVLIAIIAFGTGLIQLTIGKLGAGKFIKYIPYPVIAGYLSGVGALIFLGQLPRFLGLSKDISLATGIVSPEQWNWHNIIIGIVAMFVMLFSSKVISKIPAAIMALLASIITYIIIGYFDKSLFVMENNSLIIGSINANLSDIINSISFQFQHLTDFKLTQFGAIIFPMITLAVLLSVDTLKTCVVLDALNNSRHDSNAELGGQGLGNILSGLLGGIPGAGTMGATLVNMSSGAKSKYSGFFSGVFAVLILLLLGKLIAWIPIAALASILLVVAIRMIDFKSVSLLQNKSTILDFCVILLVVIAAVSVNLIVAAGVGILLAIMLFLREQIHFPVIRRKLYGYQISSKKKRVGSVLNLLNSEKNPILLFELQGQLFFGTTDQLRNEVEPLLAKGQFVIFDMRKVKSLDYTAANIFKQLSSKIKENGGLFILASIPMSAKSGQNIFEYLGSLGFIEKDFNIIFFKNVDDALVWAEDKYLADIRNKTEPIKEIYNIQDFEFFAGISSNIQNKLELCMKIKIFNQGEYIFKHGETDDEMYFVRKGNVKIALKLANGLVHHFATFSQGDFFGDMAFLDKGIRSANAIAEDEVELYSLSRQEFDKLCSLNPEMGSYFFEKLAFSISQRLRITNIELTVLEGF